MRTAWVLAALLLVLAPALDLAVGTAGTVQDDEPAPPAVPWWGPTDEGDGWHLRVPVTVDSGLQGPVENLPVQVEVDLAEATLPSGWPRTSVAGRTLLQSFTLDPGSIQVVEYTNHRLPRSQPDDARLLPVDPELDDPERYLVPAQAVEGFLDRSQSAPFDPTANPVVTIRWIAPGTTQPDETRTFGVYFDVAENGHVPDITQDDPGPADLEALDWIGRGTTVVGVGEEVTVTALNARTQVTVHSYSGRDPVPVQGESKRLPAEAPTTFRVGPTPAPWLVTADGPVVATSKLQDPARFESIVAGFLPSWDGTLVGTRWALAAPDGPIHVYNPGTRPIRVTTPTVVETVSPGATTIDGAVQGGYLDLSASGPLLVQAQTQQAELYPYVSATGAPSGPVLYGTTLAVNTASGPGDPQAGHLWASALDPGPARITVDTVDDGKTVVPRGAAGGGSTDIPAWPAWAQHQAAETDQPTVLKALVAGSNDRVDPDATIVAAGGPGKHIRIPNEASTIASPIGGQEARNFSTPVPVRVFAFHASTQVTVHAGGQASQFVLEQGQQELVEADWATPARIQADKPVAVVPDNRIAYGAGSMRAGDATVGAAQYRGHLVSLEPGDDGGEPMVRSVSFGDTATFPLTIRNLGLTADGTPLEDTVNLSLARPPPPGWNASLDRDQVELGPGGSTSATLTITSPETRGTGDRVLLPVRASSQGNPNMTDEVSTLTLLRERRGVGLWFEQEDGPTQLGLRFRPGVDQTLPVVVKNNGSARDTVSLAIQNVEAGWSARFLENDTRVHQLQLASGEARHLDLAVQPPEPGGLLLPSSMTLQATSTNDTTVSAKALLDALVAADSDLSLETDEAVLTVRPGQTAAVDLRLVNEGSSSADVRLNVTGDLPPGWPDPDFRFRGQSLAPVDNRLNSVSPTDEDGIPLELVFQVPKDAPGGLTTGVLATLTPVGAAGGQPDLLPINLFVEPFVDLVHLPGPAVSVPPGGQARVPVSVSNAGDIAAGLTVDLLSSPHGWEVIPPSNLSIPAGENTTFRLPVEPPPGAAPGKQVIHLALVDDRGTRKAIEVPVRVLETARLDAGALEQTVVPPGVPTNLTTTIQNLGNVPANTTLDIDAPEGWQASTDPAQVNLAPLASERVRLTIVPADDATEPTTLTLRAGTEPGAKALAEAPTVPTRPALALLEASAVEAGEDLAAVRGVLVNEANVTIENVTVAMVSGDEVLGKTVVERIPPQLSRVVVVTAPAGDASGTVGLVVDPHERFVEDDRSDNAQEVTLLAERAEAPVPSWTVLLSAVVAAGVLRWRRADQRGR